MPAAGCDDTEPVTGTSESSIQRGDDRWLLTGLFFLTVVTGMADAASYLGLGQVFTANMTGNVLLLGFATDRSAHLSFTGSLVALVAFAAGAIGGSFLVGRRHQTPHYLRGFVVEWLILAAATVVLFAVEAGSTGRTDSVLVLLALSMGTQNAVVRRMGLPDVNTTVLTTTLGGLVADAVEVRGRPVRAGRRVATIVLLFGGAVLGSVLEHIGVGWTLLAALGMATVGIAAIEGSHLPLNPADPLSGA